MTEMIRKKKRQHKSKKEKIAELDKKIEKYQKLIEQIEEMKNELINKQPRASKAARFQSSVNESKNEELVNENSELLDEDIASLILNEIKRKKAAAENKTK